MTWGLIWLMLVLKIPVAALLWIVWWAVHQEEEPETGADGDGGTKVRPHGHRPRPPRPPRSRGPHGVPMPAAPRRVRTTIVRSREPHRH
ncbi:MAG: hypothetical protein QOF26_2493 [Baekduia sp.]|jgi:hypothetical protein|nr:hypothetical protein [Baekduia sp.]MDX6702267.1 hypothetical protein [Baekduia sp.]